MSLFKCAKCGCIENTALCTYWFRKQLKYIGDLEPYQDLPLCSECGKPSEDGTKMVPGKWHNKFSKNYGI